MDADLDTLATALYVKIDDLLQASPQWAPPRPAVGITPKLTDAELVTLAVMQALGGFTSEARWLRHARIRLRHLFPYLPQQPGYNKRLRNCAGPVQRVIRALAADTSLWTDDVWVVDSTPVECGRSRETAKRSELAGWAEYGYCPSHSRYFWGLRLHLLCTLGGLPVGFALTGAKADERQTLLQILAADPTLAAHRPGQTLIADRHYYGTGFEATLAAQQLQLLRPARKGERERTGVGESLAERQQWFGGPGVGSGGLLMRGEDRGRQRARHLLGRQRFRRSGRHCPQARSPVDGHRRRRARPHHRLLLPSRWRRPPAG